MSITDFDRRAMAAALRLARWHTGMTDTNPSVACLLVKDERIVGRGVTAAGGRPHAETIALAAAGEAARGATAYVTLEPCSHTGRTPPCADALIAAGIARCVVSVLDPDPRVNGSGIRRLIEAGIAVETGVLEEEGREGLEAYLMRQVSKRPHVTLKIAVSSDGMIGRLGAGQVAITGAISRAQVHVLRAEMDAILVGIGTALADDPELTCRTPGLAARSPQRFVLDRNLSLPLASKLVTTARQTPVVAITVNSANAAVDVEFSRRKAALNTAGVEFLKADPGDPAAFLPLMAERGISSLLVEGGAQTAKLFAESGLVDRIVIFEGPVKIGDNGIASPITTRLLPAGYAKRRQLQFGADRCHIYEREA